MTMLNKQMVVALAADVNYAEIISKPVPDSGFMKKVWGSW